MSTHGKSLSGGILNGCQKLLAFAHLLSIPREKSRTLLKENGVVFPTDSNKRPLSAGVADVTGSSDLPPHGEILHARCLMPVFGRYLS
jgi:hypothetical protein